MLCASRMLRSVLRHTFRAERSQMRNRVDGLSSSDCASATRDRTPCLFPGKRHQKEWLRMNEREKSRLRSVLSRTFRGAAVHSRHRVRGLALPLRRVPLLHLPPLALDLGLELLLLSLLLLLLGLFLPALRLDLALEPVSRRMESRERKLNTCRSLALQVSRSELLRQGANCKQLDPDAMILKVMTRGRAPGGARPPSSSSRRPAPPRRPFGSPRAPWRAASPPRAPPAASSSSRRASASGRPPPVGKGPR